MQHLFNAKLPELKPDEEERFYQHPTLPVKVNQIGVVYLLEKVKYNYNYKSSGYRFFYENGKSTSNMKIQKIIMESYTNTMHSYYRFIPLNGNLLDWSYDNMVYHSDELPKAQIRTKEFIEKSVQYMLEKDKKLAVKGIDNVLYWNMVRVIDEVRKPYEKKIGKIVRFSKDGEPTKSKPKERKKRAKKYRTKAELNEITLKVRKLIDEDGKRFCDVAKVYREPAVMIQFYYSRKLQK